MKSENTMIEGFGTIVKRHMLALLSVVEITHNSSHFPSPMFYSGGKFYDNHSIIGEVKWIHHRCFLEKFFGGGSLQLKVNEQVVAKRKSGRNWIGENSVSWSYDSETLGIARYSCPYYSWQISSNSKMSDEKIVFTVADDFAFWPCLYHCVSTSYEFWFTTE